MMLTGASVCLDPHSTSGNQEEDAPIRESRIYRTRLLSHACLIDIRRTNLFRGFLYSMHSVLPGPTLVSDGFVGLAVKRRRVTFPQLFLVLVDLLADLVLLFGEVSYSSRTVTSLFRVM